MASARDVAGLDKTQLAALMSSGRAVRVDELAGFGFRGTSLGLPAWMDRLLWKTFAKVFVPHQGELHGFNLRIDQRSTVPLEPRANRPRFGEFEVRSERETVLDYGLKNPRWSPLHPLRDTLVVVQEEPLVLLGRSYFELAGRLIPTPSYFTLERTLSLPVGSELATAHHRIEAV
ncbi:MAG: hypothetical protein KJO07_02105 [Deltaproteobacteria bacterium]|nr:hypothetical protein [Deltaproteobacteria bacterium]